jgi:hypothetical protein
MFYLSVFPSDDECKRAFMTYPLYYSEATRTNAAYMCFASYVCRLTLANARANRTLAESGKRKIEIVMRQTFRDGKQLT